MKEGVSMDVVNIYFYEITLVTPIGLRHGSLELNFYKNNEIIGILDILNHKTKISGWFFQSGECALEGVIISLMKETQYQAFGHLDKQTISLRIQGEKIDFQMYGTGTIGGIKNELY